MHSKDIAFYSPFRCLKLICNAVNQDIMQQILTCLKYLSTDICSVIFASLHWSHACNASYWIPDKTSRWCHHSTWTHLNLCFGLCFSVFHFPSLILLWIGIYGRWNLFISCVLSVLTELHSFLGGAQYQALPGCVCSPNLCKPLPVWICQDQGLFWVLFFVFEHYVMCNCRCLYCYDNLNELL